VEKLRKSNSAAPSQNPRKPINTKNPSYDKLLENMRQIPKNNCICTYRIYSWRAHWWWGTVPRETFTQMGTNVTRELSQVLKENYQRCTGKIKEVELLWGPLLLREGGRHIKAARQSGAGGLLQPWAECPWMCHPVLHMGVHTHQKLCGGWMHPAHNMDLSTCATCVIQHM
jgi:hypothetical protein